jgi:two-component system, response regulator RegA
MTRRNHRKEPRLLLADDDLAFCQTLGWALEGRGFQVAMAHDAADTVRMAREDVPDFAMVDLKMPGPSGLTVLAALKQINPRMRILVLTGYASIATAIEAIKLGATHYLAKPVDAEDVIAAFGRESGDPLAGPGARQLSAAEFEWEHIQKVLTENQGNVSATARQLNIHRRTLQRKFAKRRKPR